MPKRKRKSSKKPVKKSKTKKIVFLLDIEGTTTPITFVSDTLFPYVRNTLSQYLDKHWDELKDDIEALKKQAIEDKTQFPDIPQITETKQSVIDNVKYNMDKDRKISPLKTLQGKMWKGGYESGELKGSVYKDAYLAMKKWKEQNIPIYIYSSGSVLAQKLLFQYSEHGDMLPLISGHYDTVHPGLKTETKSYEVIAKELVKAEKPTEIIFVTDNINEAKACKEASKKKCPYRCILSIRPGTAPLPENHGFETITSFDQLEKFI